MTRPGHASESQLLGYIAREELGVGIENYIASPGLGSRAGPLGALALAADALVGSRTGGLPSV